MTQLQMNVLGRFDVLLNGEMVTWFPTERVRALLLVLAASPQLRHERAGLATLLWSDVEDKAAKRNLRSCLSRLKKMLGEQADEFLSVSRREIGLVSAESDHNTFQTLIDDDNPSAWQTAADLNMGEFAAGFSLKNSPLFDEWLSERRLLLVRQQRDLLQKLLDNVAVNPNEHLRYAEQLVATDPFDDVGQRAVMTAHVALGNTAAALAHFERYAAFLQEELSAEPEAATRALYQQLVASIADKPAPLHNFPRQIAPFIGRTADRDAVLEMLGRDACQMVTILGAGGMGKTWLATEVARHVTSAQFADGVYFVPLVNATTEYDAVAMLHRTLALPMQGSDILGQVLEHLRHKRLLLMLDNLEQLSGQLRFLARLVQAAKGVKILTTSRDVVGISAEYRYPLAGITDLHESTAILWSAIRRVAPNFEATPANIAIGAVICERLHGVPLALELAATWINTLDLESIREEIEHAYSFLESPMLDTPDRHRSLSAIFDHSWELLQPKQQRVLAAASIFRGGFDMKAARAVLGAGIHDLRRLVEQSLLLKADDRAHYTLHELVRQFAAEKLSATDKATAQQAHADYYLSLVAGLEQQLVSENALAASKVIDADMANVRAAWRAASAESLLKAVTGMARFYRLTGRYSEGNTLFLETIERLDAQTDAELLARLHIGCATFRIWQTQTQRAIDSAEKALAVARLANNKALIAESLSCWGQALRVKGAYRLAVPKLQEGLAISEGGNAHAVRGEIFCNLAIIASFSGQPDRALQVSKAALAAARLVGDKVIEVHALNVLAFALNQRFENSTALECSDASLKISRQMGNLAGEALARIIRGRIYIFLGQYALATPQMTKARKLYRSIEDPLGEIYSLTLLTRCHLQSGEYGAAAHYAKQALAEAISQGAVFHQANVQLMRARLLCYEEQFGAARHLVREVGALQAAQQLPPTFRIPVRFGLAEIDFYEGKMAIAGESVSAEIDEILAGNAPLQPNSVSHLYLLAYKILLANNDPRAAQLLDYTINDIETKAARITDPAHRQSFLENIPYHHALLSQYAVISTLRQSSGQALRGEIPQDQTSQSLKDVSASST